LIVITCVLDIVTPSIKSVSVTVSSILGMGGVFVSIKLWNNIVKIWVVWFN